MHKLRFTVILIATSAALFAGDADPFAGTWRLNPHKSKYAGGPCPKDMMIQIQTTPNGISYHSETIGANGRRTRASYTADYSGLEAIVIGTSGLMAPVSLHRIDARTIVASYKGACRWSPSAGALFPKKAVS
jgi:hypothetical protein